MRILGIETSCDETAIAVVNETNWHFVVEKNLLSSQSDLHAKYGGVVPEVAAREHAVTLFSLLEQLEISKQGDGIDVVAVTRGPGLVPALRIGVELGKTLAWDWKKPLVGVNHLEGHIYSVWLDNPVPKFPALCLIVSGGHTELILMKDYGNYELLGMTRDDAAGEAFDKVAKLLGLEYPGGPKISKQALEGNAEAVSFPRPMINSGDFDFSFSGLKTAVRNYVEEIPLPSNGSLLGNGISDIAASFQQAVVDVLVYKTIKAAREVGPKSIILTGGVSANAMLRETLSHAVQKLDSSISFHAPEIKLTGDNAVMIALAGFFRAQRKDFIDPLSLSANPNMRLA